MPQRSLVPLFVFVGVSGCLLVLAILTRPKALSEVRSQLTGVDSSDIIYIESVRADGSHGFTNDPATVSSCVNAIKNATGSGVSEANKGVPIYFYLKPGPTGVLRRRPIFISSRDNARSELGPGMQDCLANFDRTSKVDPPGH